MASLVMLYGTAPTTEDMQFFNKGTNYLIRSDYGNMVSGRDRSLCISVVDQDLSRREKIVLDIRRVGFRKVTGLYDDDPNRLAEAIRNNNPGFLVLSMSDCSRPVLRRVYELVEDLF